MAFRKELNSNSECKSKKEYHPGCTAIGAVIVENRLFVANAGDCRAILCRAGSAIPLSKVVITYLIHFYDIYFSSLIYTYMLNLYFFCVGSCCK